MPLRPPPKHMNWRVNFKENDQFQTRRLTCVSQWLVCTMICHGDGRTITCLLYSSLLQTIFWQLSTHEARSMPRLQSFSSQVIALISSVQQVANSLTCFGCISFHCINILGRSFFDWLLHISVMGNLFRRSF